VCSYRQRTATRKGGQGGATGKCFVAVRSKNFAEKRGPTRKDVSPRKENWKEMYRKCRGPKILFIASPGKKKNEK